MPEVLTSPIELMRQYSEAEAPLVELDLEAEKKKHKELFDLPSELIEAPSITICSIWPFPLDSQPFHHGGRGRQIYSIAAGSVENPAYLKIKNTWDYILVQEGVGQVGHMPAPILASALVKDLINFWTGDHPGNRRGKKGVGAIRGTYATPQELKELEKYQKAWLTYLVERADENWDNGKREKIGNEHRRAFRMLGLDEAQHPWVRSRVLTHNSCPWCESRVATTVLTCGQCRGSILEYYAERMDEFNPAMWPKVSKEIERLAKKQSSRTGEPPEPVKRKPGRPPKVVQEPPTQEPPFDVQV